MILIGCGKSKIDHAAPARELYTGSLFRAARDYAEGKGKPWAIVSAKYGLLLPETMVKPYEQRLRGSVGVRARWAQGVVADAVVLLWPGSVVLLMGRDYADPLERAFMAHEITVKRPLDGLSLGQRLKWFKERR
jgi:hypothetical protein